MDRRQVLSRGAALTTTLALSAAPLWRAIAAGERAKATPHDALLDLLAELTIPSTGTPGARAAGVPAFVTFALERGLGGESARYIPDLARALATHAGASFLSAPPERQHEVLEALDARAYSFATGEATTPVAVAWRTVKTLIVLGYYTSEIGATRELRYEFVPARFDADIPLGADDVALMNDWYGNTF
jgi:hypothetical protein